MLPTIRDNSFSVKNLKGLRKHGKKMYSMEENYDTMKAVSFVNGIKVMDNPASIYKIS